MVRKISVHIRQSRHGFEIISCVIVIRFNRVIEIGQAVSDGKYCSLWNFSVPSLRSCREASSECFVRKGLHQIRHCFFPGVVRKIW